MASVPRYLAQTLKAPGGKRSRNGCASETRDVIGGVVLEPAAPERDKSN